MATVENDDRFNVYTVYDLSVDRPCPVLNVVLMCEDGNEFAFRYPPTGPGQMVLLGKVDACYLEQTDMTLADFRARYLVGEPQSRQVPNLVQL